jgi:hypothetical protein
VGPTSPYGPRRLSDRHDQWTDLSWCDLLAVSAASVWDRCEHGPWTRRQMDFMLH